MHPLLKEIEVVGFDLDQTLYPDSDEIRDRVRTEIARRILKKIPSLENIEKAREYFEENYKELKGGYKVLEKAGYENGRSVMDECLANANVVDIISPDEELGKTIELLSRKYILFLITSSPEKLALEKLEKIKINPA